MHLWSKWHALATFLQPHISIKNIKQIHAVRITNYSCRALHFLLHRLLSLPAFSTAVRHPWLPPLVVTLNGFEKVKFAILCSLQWFWKIELGFLFWFLTRRYNFYKTCNLNKLVLTRPCLFNFEM